MNKSKIEWCDYTWNPVTGCLHGCEYCYARRIANRFSKGREVNKQVERIFAEEFGEPVPGATHESEGKHYVSGVVDPYPYGFEPTFHRYRLDEPQKKTKCKNIFVSSMGDLFGEWVPEDWIKAVFEACLDAPQHNYIFLTKNPKRYGQLNGSFYNYSWDTHFNSWFGTTITCQDDLQRIRHLPYGKAKTFLSIEPLKGEIDLRFYLPQKTTKCKCSYCGHHADNYSAHCQHCGKEGGYSGSFRRDPINWIIVGAQTGPGAIKPKSEWVQSVINQAKAAGIPIFLKDNLKWPEKIQELPKELMHHE